MEKLVYNLDFTTFHVMCAFGDSKLSKLLKFFFRRKLCTKEMNTYCFYGTITSFIKSV